MKELTFLKVLMLTRQVHQECIICHHWYFLDKLIKFQLDVCNGCHNVLMTSMNLNGIAILNIYGVDYHLLLMELAKVKF